ncbi:hypothetical protein GQR58_030093 [Nymphon striatum]|nr:hypothetical protein GQR58_030093 [Nymphon striatum]
MATIINHAAFVDPANFRSKAKPPHRYVASALMAMGATTTADWAEIADDLIANIIDSGEIPYVVGPPTGYPDESNFWISGSSMLTRFDIAQMIAYHPPLVATLKARAGTNGDETISAVDAVAGQLVPGGLSNDSLVAVLDHVAANAATNDGRISAAAHLIMCSPEFVRF